MVKVGEDKKKLTMVEREDKIRCWRMMEYWRTKDREAFGYNMSVLGL